MSFDEYPLEDVVTNTRGKRQYFDINGVRLSDNEILTEILTTDRIFVQVDAITRRRLMPNEIFRIKVDALKEDTIERTRKRLKDKRATIKHPLNDDMI